MATSISNFVLVYVLASVYAFGSPRGTSAMIYNSSSFEEPGKVMPSLRQVTDESLPPPPSHLETEVHVKVRILYRCSVGNCKFLGMQLLK